MNGPKGLGTKSLVVAIIIIAAAVGAGAFAFTSDDEVMNPPDVEVDDQTLSGSTVSIDTVVAREDGWIVIHRNDDGNPGAVIGHSEVAEGTNNNESVEIDNSKKTGKLYAMLHLDTGQMGTYEFPDEDPPVEADGEIVVTSFQIEKTTEPATDWIMTGNAFSPQTIEIEVGDTVRITNEDGFTHNFTAQNPETEEIVINQNVGAGESLTFTFDTEGVWKVWCTIHSDGTETEPATTGMKGKVGVGVSVSSDDDGDGDGNGGYY